MDILISEVFSFTDEFIEGAPFGLLVALIPYFIIFIGVAAGRNAKAWIGPFLILYSGVFLQVYRKMFGSYEINVFWLIFSVIIVCASFKNLKFIKRPVVKYIKDTLYVGDLVTLFVFSSFLVYGILRIRSPKEDVEVLPCILIALIITAITLFLYETITAIFVTAAGSAGLLLAINQISYYNPYEETPDKAYLCFLFLRVFAAGVLVQIFILVVSSIKPFKDAKFEEALQRERAETKRRQLESERRAKESLDGAIDYMDEHTNSNEKRRLAKELEMKAVVQDEQERKEAEALAIQKQNEQLEYEKQYEYTRKQQELEAERQNDYRWYDYND